MKDYKYKGVVNIDEVLINLYKKKVTTGERLRSSPYLRRTLELHNEGMSPIEIGKELSKIEGAGHIQSGRVLDWLTSAGVKPNEAKRTRKHRIYKHMTEEMFNSIVIEMMGTGASGFDVLQTKFSGEIKFDDGTTEKVNSKYIFNNILNLSRKKYMNI